MKRFSEHFSWLTCVLLAVILLAAVLLCICVGSVSIPLGDTVRTLWAALTGQEIPAGMARSIIMNVRLPRVLNVALVGASLTLCGAAMQGLLRNPLADGSTLGVSGGASLGAVLALALGVRIPGGPVIMAMAGAFLSLAGILALAFAIDRSLSTNTIILIGVIFSMFTSSAINLIVSFAPERAKSITFWTMGSLAGTNTGHTALLAAALAICGGVILHCRRELDAFALGEDNARHIGVNVRRVRLMLLTSVSCLTGVCVSVGGTIGFVGLVAPHMTRMITGPAHGRLLSASIFSGAIFLLMADLAARTILAPVELSIGVVTSLIGAAAFLIIFIRRGKGR